MELAEVGVVHLRRGCFISMIFFLSFFLHACVYASANGYICLVVEVQALSVDRCSLHRFVRPGLLALRK